MSPNLSATVQAWINDINAGPTKRDPRRARRYSDPAEPNPTRWGG
jgi:hypothetical protein